MEENKQHKLDSIYLRMAKIWSENSYAIRRQVGCLVVKDNMIISDGYNGTPSGFENVCETIEGRDKPIHGRDELVRTKLKLAQDQLGAKLLTKPYVLHAEANALTKLARSGNSSNGATLYVTDEPCIECSKLIIQSGIKRVVYERSYHSHQGIEILKRANIIVDKYETD